MAKHYPHSNLVGMDVKPHHHRRVRPNRYKPTARRRWVISAAVAITLFSLVIIAGVWP